MNNTVVAANQMQIAQELQSITIQHGGRTLKQRHGTNSIAVGPIGGLKQQSSSSHNVGCFRRRVCVSVKMLQTIRHHWWLMVHHVGLNVSCQQRAGRDDEAIHERPCTSRFVVAGPAADVHNVVSEHWAVDWLVD
eukprot:TRINITY_DN1811_c2_g1_i1.p2 TRINITY_DN1811_c2_g1~~TRINITY_DN1811_c2_g1_i1.p2  ORF type:complete len:135 (+),score=11.73 TRINITY_DN1811_c2_g1_i1:1705-2109(+)